MQKKKHSSARNYSGSVIISLILSFIGYIKTLAQESVILSYFENYDNLEHKCKDSLIANKLSVISAVKFKLLSFRMACAKRAQESIIISWFNRLSARLLSTRLRSYGIFFSSYGLFLVFASAARNPEKILAFNYSDSFIFGTVLSIISLLMIPVKKKNLSTCLRESKVLSYIIHDIFSADFLIYENNVIMPSSGMSFVLGLALGAISYLTSPVLVAFVFFLSVILYMIFSKPENGILLICLLLPFSFDKILLFLILTTAISDFFKIVRGKRSFHINICSIALFLLAVVVISSAVFSYDSVNALSGIAPFMFSILLGILIITLVNSSTLAEKCCKMLSISAVLTALYGFYRYIVVYINNRDFSDILNSILNHGMTSAFRSTEYFGAFLIAMLPIMVLRFKTNTKLLSVASISLLAVCLVLTNSYYAVISIIIAFVITMTVFSRHGVLTTAVAALFIAFFRYMMPAVTNTSIGKYISNISPTILEKTAGIPDFLSEFWLHGAGAGTDSVAYASVSRASILSVITGIGGSYLELILKLGIPLTIVCILLISVFFVRITSYALGKYNSPAAKHQCTVLFCSLVAVVIYALFSSFLFNFKICALIFILLSLGSAIADSADNDYISPSRLRENIF